MRGHFQIHCLRHLIQNHWNRLHPLGQGLEKTCSGGFLESLGHPGKAIVVLCSSLVMDRLRSRFWLASPPGADYSLLLLLG